MVIGENDIAKREAPVRKVESGRPMATLFVPARSYHQITDLLVANPPWYQQPEAGNDLSFGASRSIKRLQLGDSGVWIVIKESYEMLPSILHQPVGRFRRTFANDNIPVNQMKIIAEAQRRYREEYGEKLSMEQPVAGYIDRRTGRMFMAFMPIEEIKPRDLQLIASRQGLSEEAYARLEEKYWEAMLKGNEVWDKLHRVGVTTRDPRLANILVRETGNPDNPFEPVLVDTEKWTIGKAK